MDVSVCIISVLPMRKLSLRKVREPTQVLSGGASIPTSPVWQQNLASETPFRPKGGSLKPQGGTEASNLDHRPLPRGPSPQAPPVSQILNSPLSAWSPASVPMNQPFL